VSQVREQTRRLGARPAGQPQVRRRGLRRPRRIRIGLDPAALHRSGSMFDAFVCQIRQFALDTLPAQAYAARVVPAPGNPSTIHACAPPAGQARTFFLQGVYAQLADVQADRAPRLHSVVQGRRDVPALHQLRPALAGVAGGEQGSGKRPRRWAAAPASDLPAGLAAVHHQGQLASGELPVPSRGSTRGRCRSCFLSHGASPRLQIGY
jgi:hypothetical protein